MCQCLDSHLVEFLMGLYRGHHRQSQPGMSTNQGTKCWMSCTSFGASCRWVSSDLVWRVGYPWAPWKPWAPDPGLPSCRSTSKPSWWPALAHPSWCRGSMLDPWTMRNSVWKAVLVACIGCRGQTGATVQPYTSEVIFVGWFCFSFMIFMWRMVIWDFWRQRIWPWHGTHRNPGGLETRCTSGAACCPATMRLGQEEFQVAKTCPKPWPLAICGGFYMFLLADSHKLSWWYMVFFLAALLWDLSYHFTWRIWGIHGELVNSMGCPTTFSSRGSFRDPSTSAKACP